MLIAADGIHSAVREKLYPQEGPPIWNGRILWRGITAGRSVPLRPHHDHGRPRNPEIRLLSDFKERRRDGKFSINWVAERHMPPTYQWRREDYNRAARLEEFLPWFEDWTIRLARRARPDPQLPARLRISAGRPRSGRAMDVRPGHPDGRRRASDVSDRLQRRLAGDPRCPRSHPRDPGARPDQRGAAGL